MSFFKKAMHFVHPGSRLFDKRGDGGQGYINLGQGQANSAALDQAMKDYGNIETTIRDRYTDAAKKAGTFSNSAEFQNGLNSEVQAGVRGARVDAVNRINALRKAGGWNEEFKPEGYDQTQGNNTSDKLAESPEKEDTPAPPTGLSDATPTQATPANAAGGVQNRPRGGTGFLGTQGRQAALRRATGGFGGIRG